MIEKGIRISLLIDCFFLAGALGSSSVWDG